MVFIDNLDFEQCPDLELEWCHNGMETVPGYLVDCTDGHTYLVFAPDTSSLKHMHFYYRLFKMIKRAPTNLMFDHMFDPIRSSVQPALSHGLDEFGDHKVYHAPASEMGKIYLVK